MMIAQPSLTINMVTLELFDSLLDAMLTPSIDIYGVIEDDQSAIRLANIKLYLKRTQWHRRHKPHFKF